MTGKDVPPSLEFATQGEITFKYKVAPEYAQIYKSSIIKNYSFPMIENEKFVTESWIQDQIDTKYQFKMLHHPIMVCEYLDEGYTNNYYRLIKSNPVGFSMFYSQRVRIMPFFKARIIAAIHYNAVIALCNRNEKIKREISPLYLFTMIPGVILRKTKLK